MNYFIIISILFIILLTACSEEVLTKEQTAFKSACGLNHGFWMKMSELKSGMIVGHSCYGCMHDYENHFCSQKEYDYSANKKAK